MPDILVVPLFQVSPQAQLLHGKIYYIADRHVRTGPWVGCGGNGRRIATLMETRGDIAKTTALKMGLAGANFAQIAAGGKLPDGFHLLRIAECFEVTPEEIPGLKMRVKLDSNPNPLPPETPNDGGTSQQSPRKDDGDARPTHSENVAQGSDVGGAAFVF
jgi:hypothetical protein